jgi:hypothetical protein
MRRRQFTSLPTTCGKILEPGTIIRHVPGAWVNDGPHQPEHRHYHWVGTITRMEQCESGIWLHCRTTQGHDKTAHVRACLCGLKFAIVLRELGSETKILTRAPQQMEIRA